MSLRIRLTLLYTALMGGIILLFGVVSFQLISVTLIDQVDTLLENTSNELIKNIRLDNNGNLTILPSPNLEFANNVYIQVWSRDNELIEASMNIRWLKKPLDPRGRHSAKPLFRDVIIEGAHIRVLSVPLTIGERPIGVLQVGASLAIVDATQSRMLTALIFGVVIAMALSALSVSITTYRSLAPLNSVTQTALHITRADDLSRRIPYQGSPDDEIGQLIHAFNQTLSRLENLFHAQRQFVADVGHELRTPLTVIKGNVSLMRKYGSDDELLGIIENEVDRLTRMVEDLLLLAQAESGKLPLDFSLVELDTLILEVLQQTKVLAHDKVSLHIGEIDQVLVCGDHDRLKQVFINLISNAIKYTPDGGEVVIAVGKVKDKARIIISDTGQGIPKEELPHIFERFYRAEKSRTRSKDRKGFGLGLSIAYWIVRNHGGQIDVDSKVGKGTTVCVWLPLAEGNECNSPPKPINKAD